MTRRKSDPAPERAVRHDGLSAMDRIAGLEDLFPWRPADIRTVVDGTQPCNSGDIKRRDTFHPEKGNQSSIPRKDCGACPFRVPCAHYAVHHEALGYWGGLSTRDRWDIRKELGIPLESPAPDYMPKSGLLSEARKRQAAERSSLREPVRNNAGHIIGWTDVAA